MKNEKLEKEAKEIDEFANQKKVEALYRSFKSDNSSFTEKKTEKRCDQGKLRDHFEKHFTSNTIVEDPIELIDIPEFMFELQRLPIKINTEPPAKKELIGIIKKMKNGKSANDIQIEYILSLIHI